MVKDSVPVIKRWPNDDAEGVSLATETLVCCIVRTPARTTLWELALIVCDGVPRSAHISSPALPSDIPQTFMLSYHLYGTRPIRGRTQLQFLQIAASTERTRCSAVPSVVR